MVATGHVWLLRIWKCGQSELRCAVRVKQTLGFRHFIFKYNVNYLFRIVYMLKWSYFGPIGLSQMYY